jgi:hypothetical protein
MGSGYLQQTEFPIISPCGIPGRLKQSRDDISSNVANARVARQLPRQSPAAATDIDDKMPAA